VRTGPVLLGVRRVLPLLLVGALGGALAGCGGSSSAAGSVPKDAVAVVGSQTVSLDDFDSLVRQEQLAAAQQSKGFPVPGTKAYDVMRDQATAYLVHSAEFKQKAAQLGITVSQQEIDRAVASLKKLHFGGSEQKYEAARNAQGLTEADVRANQEFQLLTNKLFKKVTRNTTVSDAAVRAYYDAHRAEFRTKDSRTVRHILVATKAKADRLYSMLRAGASFVALENKYSLDSGPGRLLMPISKGDTVPNFEAVAFGLKTGQIARPVKTAAGWHVVQALTPVRMGSQLPFAKVEAQIRKQLETAKQTTVMNTWMQGVQRNFCHARIEYAKDYAPAVDPCKAVAKTTAPAATTTTG
jgi:parvulin-like peptidyl-prolyl isomerase